MKLFVVLFSLVFFASQLENGVAGGTVPKAPPKINFQCEPGIEYLLNGCYVCNCDKPAVEGTPGEMKCTRYKQPCEPELAKCEPDTLHTEGCNKCQCFAGLGKLCTNRFC